MLKLDLLGHPVDCRRGPFDIFDILRGLKGCYGKFKSLTTWKVLTPLQQLWTQITCSLVFRCQAESLPPPSAAKKEKRKWEINTKVQPIVYKLINFLKAPRSDSKITKKICSFDSKLNLIPNMIIFKS